MDHLAAVHARTELQAPRRTAPAWLVLLVVCGGQFLVVLDISVVNVAMPSMRADLGLTEAGLQWVVNAYTLAFAGLLLLGGRVADSFGRERTFLIGLGLFTATSLAGGLSHEPWMLITARAVQGVGGAVLAPTTLSILTTTFPEAAERARAVATWAAVGAAGGAAGGLFGGVLTDYLSWRWVLLINVPIGVLLVLGATLCLTLRRGVQARRLDLSGAVLATTGMAAVSYGIAQSGPQGWTSRYTLLPLVVGLVALGLFVLVESRSAEPLMPLWLLRIRSVSTANVVLFGAGAGTMAVWYFLSLYLQNVLHYSPVRTGLSLLPHTVSVMAGSKLAPRLMGRMDARLVGAIGGLLTACGLAWQSTVVSADGTFLDSILGPGVLTLFGAGLLGTPITMAATTGAPSENQGVVSGLLNTSSQLGGALGLTVLATASADRIATEAGAAGRTEQALAAGYSHAFLVAAAFLLVTTALIARLPKPALY